MTTSITARRALWISICALHFNCVGALPPDFTLHHSEVRDLVLGQRIRSVVGSFHGQSDELCGVTVDLIFPVVHCSAPEHALSRHLRATGYHKCIVGLDEIDLDRNRDRVVLHAPVGRSNSLDVRYECIPEDPFRPPGAEAV